MKLKSFGCSFIFGSDLSDEGCSELYKNGSQLTWPALLSQDLGYDYCTYARPGSGNLRIMEKVLTESTVNDSSIFVIGWTWIDRFDYTVTPAHKIPQWDLAGADQWKTTRPMDNDSAALSYYRDLYSQFQSKLVSLIYIKTAIDILKQHNISFIMTYIDELLFETKWHTSPAIIDLQNYIKPHMTKFENKTFLDFSKEKGFPISETLHPLEVAHQAAFELIRTDLDTILHKA
jgi:hypothetical protein